MFLSLLLVTAIGVGGYAWTIYNQSTDALSHTYKGFGNETNVIAETKPLTILLMGVDTGSGSRAMVIIIVLEIATPCSYYLSILRLKRQS